MPYAWPADGGAEEPTAAGANKDPAPVSDALQHASGGPCMSAGAGEGVPPDASTPEKRMGAPSDADAPHEAEDQQHATQRERSPHGKVSGAKRSRSCDAAASKRGGKRPKKNAPKSTARNLEELLRAMQAAAVVGDRKVEALPGWAFCICPASTESGDMQDHLMARMDMDMAAASKAYDVLTGKTRPEKRNAVANSARGKGALVAVHSRLWPRAEDAGPPLDDQTYYVVYVKKTELSYVFDDKLKLAKNVKAQIINNCNHPVVVLATEGTGADMDTEP